MLDPETIDGDYKEAYQRWVYVFNKANDKTEECFRECAFVPFEPKYEPVPISIENQVRSLNNILRNYRHYDEEF